MPLQANSEQFVTPSGTPPSARKRATHHESRGATKPANRREPKVAGRPASHRLSLTVKGTPASGSDSPAASRASTCRAAARGTSGSKSAKALS
jgi:hypothetical protein